MPRNRNSWKTCLLIHFLTATHMSSSSQWCICKLSKPCIIPYVFILLGTFKKGKSQEVKDTTTSSRRFGGRATTNWQGIRPRENSVQIRASQLTMPTKKKSRMTMPSSTESIMEWITQYRHSRMDLISLACWCTKNVQCRLRKPIRNGARLLYCQLSLYIDDWGRPNLNRK
jgi:hypothetical protein